VRYLVLSDIHANIDALEAVLQAAPPDTYDRVIVLGDLVGYCAEPNLVVARIRDLKPCAVIRGNHDKVAAGLSSADAFNPTAQYAAEWTRETATDETLVYLASLPEGPLALDEQVEMCHGSPADEDSYIFGEMDALDAFASASRPVCLFGHTHLPAGIELDPHRVLEVLFRGMGDEQHVRFEPGARYLVNPGSVGQPRDGDPRAAFARLDTHAAEFVIQRVDYPVERARDRILAAGLPKALANRLLVGR
jgi:predicted phosphodiesterase